MGARRFALALAIGSVAVCGCGGGGDGDIRVTGRAYDRGAWGEGCIEFQTRSGDVYALIDGPDVTAEQVVIESDARGDITLVVRVVEEATSACRIGPVAQVVSAEVACTLEVRYSLAVSVTGPDGAPLGGAEVTYRVDDGDPRVAECVEESVTATGCSAFVAGWEETGVFRVAASLAGHRADAQEVTVKAGLCHVRTEPVTLQLLPE